jgi:hypothetical protein
VKCFFFGCWGEPGHFIHAPGGARLWAADHLEYFGDHVHLDGNLAPRIVKRSPALCWAGRGKTVEDRRRLLYESDECPQGQFLLHLLDTGYTAIAWWDRTQGDSRSGCNSTLLLEGEHTAEGMLTALRTHFPTVLANLTKAGVQLVDVGVQANGTTPCPECLGRGWHVGECHPQETCGTCLGGKVVPVSSFREAGKEFLAPITRSRK